MECSLPPQKEGGDVAAGVGAARGDGRVNATTPHRARDINLKAVQSTPFQTAFFFFFFSFEWAS